ncbi:hypothetical protein L5515_012357 [Caenorhabditis briggsae]|uniref:Mos1 transposase HTH domain-containing protein n=1 Tax=Caenorhabditis briggsae TaxID=6238 RepID=A0AAE9EX92_CAEBR|nr:hypothetical protein L5515_012357 [Caenorhabditis briggsae]
MSLKLDEACRMDPKIIFYEFRSGLPAFECYTNFCARMGPNSLDFPEFEFWFQRFLAGNFDLDYDRSKDPKCRTLTDMPVQVFGKICENLGGDYQKDYRFIFRHVCKSFRALADSWIPDYKEISIKLKNNNTIIGNFDDEKIKYEDGNRAFSDLMSILTYPDLKLSRLQLHPLLDKRFLNELILKLESLKIKIHVDTVHLDHCNWNLQMRLLPFYRAETVKMVYIKGWQSWIAKILEEIALKPESSLFSRMEIKFGALHVKEATTIIKELLQFPNLEYCNLDVELRTTVQLKKNIERFGAKVQADDPDTFHCPILYSTDYFEIQLRNYGISIEKKSNST